MKYFKEFKCPNGQPPESCLHTPQLVANLLDYLTKKSAMRKERTKDHDTTNTKEPKPRASDVNTNGQKQRRRS